MQPQDLTRTTTKRLSTAGVPLAAGLALGAAGCDFLGDVAEFSLWVVLIIVLLVALFIYGVIRMLF